MAQPKQTSSITRQIFIAIGVFGLLLIFALAFVLGKTAQNPAQRNLEEKLLLVRRKAADCHEQREHLRSQRRNSMFDSTPIGKLQKEIDILADENNDLMEENENLREEKNHLEVQLDELRAKVDQREQISATTESQLEEMQARGNISEILKSFLQESEDFGGIDKDELIPRLIDELRWRKHRYQACQKSSATGGARIEEVRKELEDKKSMEMKEQLDSQKRQLEKTQKMIEDLLAKHATLPKREIPSKSADTSEQKPQLTQEQIQAALAEHAKQESAKKQQETKVAKPEEEKKATLPGLNLSAEQLQLLLAKQQEATKAKAEEKKASTQGLNLTAEQLQLLLSQVQGKK